MISTQTNTISKTQAWILASRPRTLAAALVPVLVGTAIAVHDSKFQPLAALIALICALLIQIGTNFVNDLFDFLHGTDKKDRVGPLRVIASGLITKREMKIAIYATFGISFLFGLYLVHLGGVFILCIGIFSILAGIAYTAGPFPLAYNGLGDIAVFIFFGFVGTVGTYYVQAAEISAMAFWSSVPVGALITNILVVNNYRDREEDRSNGKKTLIVIFGERFGRLQYLFFMLVSYFIPFVVYYTFKKELFVFLPLLSLPLAIKLIRMIYTLRGRELNKTLELTAKLSALYGLLFAAGILL
ncbi:MAG: 1,4-dihydroxy-2-naphthoate polyprenyltransferase [Ignavibacteriae bacterium HGW-Ignavibacteriae-3]|nr:MAG: 1,4-dihydroxy-2-naphthoate polyprenyltransferase [Ignavibacteriae bacterium HGW-Ignavibacteriae-3]